MQIRQEIHPGRGPLQVESSQAMKLYFTEFTFRKGVFYGIVLTYVVAVCVVCVLELFLDDRCEADTTVEYGNPMYRHKPCYHTRRFMLLFLTRFECSFGRRLLASVLLGGVVGWERREADRPAGIRTMSLVSLGACLFSINSAFAFLDGPMSWDASRVAAAIPSGVGFLGAGLIFKEAEKDKHTGDTSHVVHGLTTAASLWISAAIGVACAGQLYFAATFSVAVLLVLLRFGPRQRLDDSPTDEDEAPERGYGSSTTLSDGDRADNLSNEAMGDPELQPLKRQQAAISNSFRKRAHLGGIL